MKLFLLILSEVWQTLNTYRLRSCLTALGIIVGVTAVVLTLAIGEGIRAEIQRSLQSLGTNILNIGPNFSAGSNDFSHASYLSIADADAIRDLPGIMAVAPITENNTKVVAGAENRNTDVE